MTQDEFTKHACEQVLRFARVDAWDGLSEETKVQLGFNMGVIALGLGLSKEDGYLALAGVRAGNLPMPAFRQHVQRLVEAHRIVVDPVKVERPF